MTPGDPALQVIAFPPGDTRINPAAQGRLKRIAKALEERPRVKIELIGMYEPASDTRGLKRLRVLRKVQARQYAALPAKQRAANPVGATKLSSGEYERFLLHVYKASPAGRKAKSARNRNASGPGSAGPQPRGRSARLSPEARARFGKTREHRLQGRPPRRAERNGASRDSITLIS